MEGFSDQGLELKFGCQESDRERLAKAVSLQLLLQEFATPLVI